MQTGRETLAGIEDALRDVKSQEATLTHELETANQERVALVADRLGALRRLATIRARDAMADGVIDEADNLTYRVRGILEARLKTIAALEGRQVKAEAERAAHVARQDELTRRIAGLEERLDHFGAEARAALKDDPKYREYSDTHAALAATLDKAAEKAEQVTRDEHEKGLPYRGDPLFMYLWQRKLGTPQYRATGVIRALDEWVARLVRYAEARANYALLTEIPVRLRAHAEDLRRQVAEAKAAIDELEAQRTRELAGADLIAELTAERKRQTELSQQLDVTIATLAAPLDSRSSVVRSEEAAVGNLVADAIRHATGAQIAITNGGSLRGNRTYPAGYALTRRDVLSELPFGNRAVLVEITGRDLKEALENGVSQIDDRSGRFPHVSGLRIVVDRKAPVRQRIKSLTHDGQPVEPDAKYKVASNDFLLAGGDGYTSLGRGRILIGKTDGRLLADIVMAYIRSLKTLDAKVEGRIVFE
jgi:hypothetical protein